MGSTLRMLWPLLRWAWRGLTRAGRAVYRVGGALGPVFGPPASGDWLSRHAADRRWPPALEGEIRRLALIFKDSFCGQCAAGPDYPQGRCPQCLEKLGKLLEAGKGHA